MLYKCKVLHFWFRNVHGIYSLGAEVLKEADEEKDLGVIINQSLKSSSHCVAAAKAANRTIGMINRTFVDRHTETFLKLYLSLVRPKLEYCIQSWRPYLKKDIDLLEKVQGRATRLMITEKGLTYEERLKKLGITTLRRRENCVET